MLGAIWSTFKKIWDMIGFAVIIFLILTCLNTFVFINAFIPSTSMTPTVNMHDRVIGYRLAYRDSGPQRYDVVIFKYPDNNDLLYIKRVIGLPGDEIDIVDGQVFVNGEATDESFCSVRGETGPGTMTFPVTVPKNSYFVLGDNRKNSEDSRYWDDHFVERDELVAKVLFRYWPFTDTKIVR